MRIQRKHCNTRCADSKILLQGAVEYLQFFLYQFFGDASGYLFNGNMSGHQCYPEVIFHQNHKGLLAISQFLLYILRMSGEGKLLRLDGMLVDGSCDNHVYHSLLIFLNGFFQCTKCSFTSFNVRFRELNLYFIIRTVHYTQAIGNRFGGGVDDTEIGRQVQ